MASSTDSSRGIDDDVRRLYERYRATDCEEERHQIALEMGKLDGDRHEEFYEALENE